jgi:hypothetical protein
MPNKLFDREDQLWTSMKKQVLARLLKLTQPEMDLSSFYLMLRRLVPALNSIPFDVFNCHTSIHIGLFVWGVKDLPAGFYFLVRNKDALPKLKKQTESRNFLWKSPHNCPIDLDLFFLKEDTVKQVKKPAQSTTCAQEVARNGCFTLGMFADLHEIKPSALHLYKQLHWECGLIGSVL